MESSFCWIQMYIQCQLCKLPIHPTLHTFSHVRFVGEQNSWLFCSKGKKKLAVGYQLHIHKTLLVEQFTPICPEKAHKSTVLRNQDYATWNTLKSPKSLDQNCSCQMAVRVTVDRCECDILLLRLAQIFSPYRKYIDCSLCWIFKNLISHNFSTFFWVNQSELLI